MKPQDNNRSEGNKKIGGKEKEDFDLFWADQLAGKIIKRDRFRYSDRKAGKPAEFVVKTAASLSGVLHIGRLSDTTRAASVHRALLDAGEKSRLIWVADDTDPLRKIPKGVPAEFEKYLGSPVSRIPDPEGCHESYAKHHVEEYLSVIGKFVFEDTEIYSMKDEYAKGNFVPFIRKLIAHAEAIREIQNKHRTNPLKREWMPWNPLCSNCDKIITTRVTSVDETTGVVSYACKDYLFETAIAKGCGHKGENDPQKDAGKLAYKSEWAAQWARWQVSCEGAGKEYQVPNSAFWINAEICEKVLDFPSPEPFFYEHLTIDGVKMSASLGNVVYPRQWLEVASPQLLRFFYNKRLMTERSFSWKDLPLLYDEYDKAAAVYSGKTVVENEKEKAHLKRLYEISNSPDKAKIEPPISLPFSHAAMVAQVFEDEKDIAGSLEKTGHYQKEQHKQIMSRISLAKAWIRMYAPDDARYVLQQDISEETRPKLSQQQQNALKALAAKLKSKKWEEKELYNECYSIAKEAGLQPPEFFRAAYSVLLNRERGPKLAPFLLALGEKAVRVLEKI
ncbi:lysine--tRNA ligase [Candidatus Woesearchaeota archaeon]|nr:lysine--tRNA ligase [Candidatus Woesearchaeota archaeon]